MTFGLMKIVVTKTSQASKPTYLAEKSELEKELELEIDRRFKELEAEAEIARSRRCQGCEETRRRDADKEI